jgi:hypothetical protein
MLKRLVTGLGKGLLLGGLLAFAAVRGLGMAAFPGAAVAYLAAALAGVVAGLIAGRPIWAREAKVEAGLKAVAGAALGAVVLFAVRRWLPYEVDLSAWQAGQGALGSLPVASLPIVSVVLSMLFDLDNTESKSLPPRTWVTAERTKQSAVDSTLEDETPTHEDEAATRGEQGRR